jgi:putative heme-binding domain-containing protein
MWRMAFLLVASMPLAAQPASETFRLHCAACHGPAGEGSRGPALRVPALKRANDTDSLVALLRRGVPGTEMPAIAPEAVPDDALRALVGYVLAMRTGRNDKASAQTGRGAELFRGKGKCTSCHRVHGEGSAAGPDLSDIGRLRNAEWLRKAILDPEASIYDSFAGYRWTISLPDNYLLVEIVTTNGERVSGGRLNEDAFSLQLRDADGRIRSFLKSEIAELRRQWGKSPMPSYRDTFSRPELDDLVAYLAGLRGVR